MVSKPPYSLLKCQNGGVRTRTRTLWDIIPSAYRTLQYAAVQDLGPVLAGSRRTGLGSLYSSRYTRRARGILPFVPSFHAHMSVHLESSSRDSILLREILRLFSLQYCSTLVAAQLCAFLLVVMFLP